MPKKTSVTKKKTTKKKKTRRDKEVREVKPKKKARKQKPSHYEPWDTWDCECGKEHILGQQIVDNWHTSMRHTCICGRQHRILEGQVALLKKKEMRV